MCISPVDGFAGVENRSSSVESPNKTELGLDLAGGAKLFVVFGFEENNSSSFSLSKRSTVLGLSTKLHQINHNVYF